jgi:transposase
LRLLLTPGQTHESKALPGLLAGLAPGAVVGDSAFDGGPSRACIAAHGAAAVVPSSPSRSRRVPHDRQLYRERNLVERCFQRLKQFRRVATRYDKTAASFLAFATIAACTVLWR